MRGQSVILVTRSRHQLTFANIMYGMIQRPAIHRESQNWFQKHPSVLRIEHMEDRKGLRDQVGERIHVTIGRDLFDERVRRVSIEGIRIDNDLLSAISLGWSANDKLR